MKRWGLALVAALLAAGYVGYTLWGPAAPPPGQPPLLTLSAATLGEFAAAFDRGAGAPRLVLLLSPT